MGKLRRVYFDSCSFDQLASDAKGLTRFQELRGRKLLALSFSPINLDEVCSILKNPSRRQTAESILRAAESVSWTKMLKSIPDTVMMLADQSQDSFPYYSGKEPWHSPKHCIDEALAWPAGDLSRTVQLVQENEKSSKESFTRIRGEILPALRARLGLVVDAPARGVPFEEFQGTRPGRLKDVLELLFPEMSSRRKRILLERPSQLLTNYCDVIFYDAWLVLSGVGAAGLGANDRRQAIYLPLVNYFVTEDGAFRRMLETIHPEEGKVMRYEEFRGILARKADFTEMGDSGGRIAY